MFGTRLALVATLVVATIPLALARAAPASDPGPLRGDPLQSHTGLRLLVSHTTPFVLDVDSGRVSQIRGLPKTSAAWVVGVDTRTAVIVTEPFSERGKLYALRDGRASLARLGAGAEVAPAGDGRSVWVKRVVRRSHCTLRRVRLDGRVLRAAKPFRCSDEIGPGGSLGVQAGPTRLLDSRTGRAVFRSRLPIVAVAGRNIVLRGRDFVVVDADGASRRRVPWPDTPGSLSQAAVDARGRFVALDFGNPSLTGPPGQAYDVWVLDTKTAKLTRLPSMPAFVWLKWTSMAWSPGGRLVLLTRDEDRQMVALWRPGQARLQLKTVQLPNRSSVHVIPAFAILG
jgi:hypothetical protein